MLADPNMTLKFSSTKTDVSKSGELGYTQGNYTMTMTDPKTKRIMTEMGRYVTVFAKQADNTWKIISDINAADAPAAPEAKPVAKPNAKRSKQQSKRPAKR
jgi:ketosteroid isomerase-like protein